jgi:hypothetical protein
MNRFNIYEPLFDPKRLFWIGMALKRKALIPHVNVLELFGPKKKTAERKTVLKRDLWFGMPLKRKVFIKHMNVLE